MKPTWKWKLLVIVTGYLSALIIWSTLEVNEMEGFLAVFSYIAENIGAIVAIIIAVTGAASLIAKLTPTQADDMVVDAILSFLNKLALNPKKDDARD